MSDTCFDIVAGLGFGERRKDRPRQLPEAGGGGSRPVYRPLELLDAHFFSRFLIVIEPLPLGQLDALELGIRLDAVGKPLPLLSQHPAVVSTASKAQTRGHQPPG